MFKHHSKRSNASQFSGSHSHSRSRSYQYYPQREEEEDEDELPEPLDLPPLSDDSSSAVPDSIWFCHDFILGAGAVIIQPATRLIVLIYQPSTRSWFLPKGRKDTGESLEQTALREAYEESGYRARFLPLALPSLAPLSPTERAKRNEQSNLNSNAGPSHSRSQSRGRAPSSAASSASRPPLELNSEPIYMTTQCLTRRRNGTLYEYVTYWYVAFIEEDAQREEDTGMPDERDYESYLVTYEEAMKRLRGSQKIVADRAYKWWRNTEKWVEEELVESVARLGQGEVSPVREGQGYAVHDGGRSSQRSGYRGSYQE